MPTYPQPPVDMVMPEFWQPAFTYSLGAIALTLFVIAAVTWFRRGKPLYLLALLGGLLASLNEPGGNILYLCWHAGVGSWEAFNFFDRPIPIWAVFAYPCYFGGMACAVYLFLQRGVTRGQMWIIAGVLFTFMALFETWCQHLGLINYYGEQPFRVFTYPAGMGTMNVIAMFGSALLFGLLAPHLKGMQWLWIVAIPATTQLGALAPMLPNQWVLNTEMSPAMKHLGVGVSLLICLFMIDSLARFAAWKFPRAATVKREGATSKLSSVTG